MKIVHQESYGILGGTAWDQCHHKRPWKMQNSFNISFWLLYWVWEEIDGSRGKTVNYYKRTRWWVWSAAAFLVVASLLEQIYTSPAGTCYVASVPVHASFFIPVSKTTNQLTRPAIHHRCPSGACQFSSTFIIDSPGILLVFPLPGHHAGSSHWWYSTDWTWRAG